MYKILYEKVRCWKRGQTWSVSWIAKQGRPNAAVQDRFQPARHRDTATLFWCPGPDSNRHGVASEGFSYPLQLSLLGRSQWRGPFGVWTFSLPCAYRCATGERLGRGRQVSTLSARSSGCARLSSGLQSRVRGAGSPNLTPFTPAVSAPGAQISQVPCVYQFRHPGSGRAAIVSHAGGTVGQDCSVVATPAGCDGRPAAGV